MGLAPVAFRFFYSPWQGGVSPGRYRRRAPTLGCLRRAGASRSTRHAISRQFARLVERGSSRYEGSFDTRLVRAGLGAKRAGSDVRPIGSQTIRGTPSWLLREP